MDKPDALMPPDPERPKTPPPPGACDAHAHLVAGKDEFPLWEGRVENPAPGPDFDGWLARYRAHLDTLGFARGVVVHSILYGDDNTVTAEAVRRLGPSFRGIGLVRDGASDADLDRLVGWNMAGVRLNYVHGGVLSWDGALALAPRLAERGLHIQMLLNTHRHMEEIAETACDLPVPLCIDHLGWPDLSRGPGEAGFQALCRLVGEGKAWVKLSALYRLCPPPYTAADPFVRALVAANPERCLWGSDWPHLMLAEAAMPRAAHLLDAFHRVVEDDATRRRILVRNPETLFGF